MQTKKYLKGEIEKVHIVSLTIDNYRNLNGCVFDFNSDLNFVIGDNNVGKSNLLSLLDTIFNAKAFEEEDFFNQSNKIEIKFGLKLLDGEIGFFGDNFSEDDSSLVNFILSQGLDEPYPTLVCADTEEALSLKVLKKVHCVNYSSSLSPAKELKTDGRGGTSLLIKNIIGKYIEEAGSFSLLEVSQVDAVKEYINDIFSKIHSVKDYSLSVNVSDKSEELVSKLIYLENNNGNIDESGSGTKYITMASLNILCKIMDIYNSKSLKFSEQIFTDQNGKKLLPLLITVDEPEVHLNPFTQRSLVKYYNRLLENKDSDFLVLLNKLFGIDGISGQLVIVTHSPDLLLGNYKNIIRLYKDGEETKIVSGKKVSLSKAEEKQLLMNFPELKTAFFSKVVIFVEGESEYGCMPTFAEKMEIDFDDHGICLINAEGEKNIRGMRSLLKQFGIESVAIYDNDVNHGGDTDPNIFYTAELCFESEIIVSLYNAGRMDLARLFVDEMEPQGQGLVLDTDFVKKWYKKNSLSVDTFVPVKIEDIDDTDFEQCKNLFSAWLYNKKSILMGRMISANMDEDIIPQSYKDVIDRAKEVASNE